MIENSNIKELLIKLGYCNEGIIIIINRYETYKKQTVYNYIINTFDYLKQKGYNTSDIVKMTMKFPSLFAYNKENIEDKINYLKSKGYSEKNIINMTIHLPIIFGLSKENIEDKFNYLKSKGYSEKDIIKITKSLPQLFGLSKENIEDKFNYLINKGYSEKDVIKMTKQFPSLFSYSKENIEDKIKYLRSKGYSEKDIIKIIRQFPSLFGLNNENIDKKIEFYKEIELENIIICDTMRLMQSVELTHARYRFLSDLGIIINEENYSSLFYGQKQFSNKYRITNDELLIRYPYIKKVKVIK